MAESSTQQIKMERHTDIIQICERCIAWFQIICTVAACVGRGLEAPSMPCGNERFWGQRVEGE
jgi:hypothetical protein